MWLLGAGVLSPALDLCEGQGLRPDFNLLWVLEFVLTRSSCDLSGMSPQTGQVGTDEAQRQIQAHTGSKWYSQDSHLVSPIQGDVFPPPPSPLPSGPLWSGLAATVARQFADLDRPVFSWHRGGTITSLTQASAGVAAPPGRTPASVLCLPLKRNEI